MTIYDRVVMVGASDKTFELINLIELLQIYEYKNLLGLMPILDTYILINHEDIRKIENAFFVKIKIYKSQNDDSKVKRANIELADYYMNFFGGEYEKSHNAIRSELYVKEAVILYRNNGDSAKAKSALSTLKKLQKEIPRQMQSIRREMNVDKLNNDIERKFRGVSFEESIICLLQYIEFMNKEKIVRDLVEDGKKNIISSMTSITIVGENGNTIVIPPLDFGDIYENQHTLDMHVFNKMRTMQNFIGEVALKQIIHRIKNTYKFKLENLDFLISNNPIIPKGRENIIRTGVFLLLNEHYYEAAHILSPQIENIFRNIAYEVGGITLVLSDDGNAQEKVLSSIFDIPELMDSYDNDILLTFKELLNEKAGANIRNEIAHGLVSEKIGSSGVYVFFGCAVIKLLSLTSKKCHEIAENMSKKTSG